MSLAVNPKQSGQRSYVMCDAGCGRPAKHFTKNSAKCDKCKAKMEFQRPRKGKA